MLEHVWVMDHVGGEGRGDCGGILGIHDDDGYCVDLQKLVQILQTAFLSYEGVFV